MTSPDIDYDVAIVGAGFAGLHLLHRCRTLGMTARIWEAGERATDLLESLLS